MQTMEILLHQIEDLIKLAQNIELNHTSRIEDLEYIVNDLRALLEQQETHIRNLRNEG